MNINFNSFSIYTVSFLRESLLPSLTAQQKKIITIVSIALSCLAACYLINRHFKSYQGAVVQQSLTQQRSNQDYLNDLEGIEDIEGEIKDGKLQGHGKVTYLDGMIEEGEFKDNRLNGSGKKTYPNGNVEEGIFVNGDGPLTFSKIMDLAKEKFAKHHFKDKIILKIQQSISQNSGAIIKDAVIDGEPHAHGSPEREAIIKIASNFFNNLKIRVTIGL